MNVKLSPRVKAFFKLSLVFFVFMQLMRLVFFFAFQATGNELTLSALAKSFYLGMKYDIRVVFGLMIPYLFFSWIKWFNPDHNHMARKFWIGFYTFIFFQAIILLFLDVGYYSYLNGRLNATIFQYFYEMGESVQMLWQSYPIVWIFTGIFATTIGCYVLFSKWVFAKNVLAVQFSFQQKAISALVITALFLTGIYGKISHYPLRWSEAFFSADPFVSALALNPIHYLFDTLQNKEKEYDIKAVEKHYPEVAKYLGIKNQKDLNFKRPIILTPMFDKKPNVVVIVMESMAAYKTGALGHPLEPTPYLDKVAEKGYLFSQFFVPSEGTARSMFGLMTGIPDVGPKRTSSRNPLIVSQNTVVNAFKGYEKFYFIGGSANWGNIRGVIANNIRNINIFEEGLYESERTDVWGLSDLQLFEEAHKKISQAKGKEPFFAIIQSSSFHRPYTIPEARNDFKETTLSSKELKKFGFISNAEYNSLRFSDYALGRFFELMDKDPRFDNTVYAIIGDHGLPDYKAAHVSKGMQQFKLEKFHVPLVIYSKKFKAPEVIDKIATSPDVLVTLAGMTGHEFENSTLGRNLFAKEYDDRRYAFTYFYYRKPTTIGLLTDNYYVTGIPRGIKSLHNYKIESPELDLKEENPQEFSRLSELTLGLYETSRYLLYHNPNPSLEKKTKKKVSQK